MKLSMQNKTSHHLEDNDEFYFDNDILNDKVHLFFKSNRISVDEYSIRGHQFLNSFELSINTLGIEHDTMLKKLGNIIFARIKQLEKEIGTLEPGKTADVVIVEGDPLKDIKSLQNNILDEEKELTVSKKDFDQNGKELSQVELEK